MTRRHVSTLFAGTMILCLVALPADGQALTGAAGGWTAPRMLDGQPDLQGRWTMATFTPLERPERFAGREFLTEKEAAALRSLLTANGTNPLAGSVFGEKDQELRRERAVQTNENILCFANIPTAVRITRTRGPLRRSEEVSAVRRRQRPDWTERDAPLDMAVQRLAERMASTVLHWS